MLTRAKALKILGFPEDSSPSPEDLKSSWRSLCKHYHPDAGGAEDKFRAVMEAYELLINKKSNAYAEFHAFRERCTNKSEQVSPREKIAHPNIRIIKPKSPLVLGNLLTPLAAFLLNQEVFSSVNIIEPCRCLSNEDIWLPCGICGETGVIIEQDVYIGIRHKTCPQCKGYGWLSKSICKDCKNQRKVNGSRAFSFSIPNDYVHGSAITLKHQGNKGWNCPDGHLRLIPVPTKFDASALSPEEISQLQDLLDKGLKGR